MPSVSPLGRMLAVQMRTDGVFECIENLEIPEKLKRIMLRKWLSLCNTTPHIKDMVPMKAIVEHYKSTFVTSAIEEYEITSGGGHTADSLSELYLLHISGQPSDSDKSVQERSNEILSSIISQFKPYMNDDSTFYLF